jgi:hypothetical protein
MTEPETIGEQLDQQMEQQEVKEIVQWQLTEAMYTELSERQERIETTLSQIQSHLAQTPTTQPEPTTEPEALSEGEPEAQTLVIDNPPEPPAPKRKGRKRRFQLKGKKS